MRVICGIAALLLYLTATSAIADEWGPWERNKSPQKQYSTSSSVLQTAIQLFQKYISPVDGQRCAMYPTCSAYSLRAIRKHGPIIGVFMTADRLFHEGDPIEQQHPINKFGYVRYYDPLKNNDFWLEK